MLPRAAYVAGDGKNFDGHWCNFVFTDRCAMPVCYSRTRRTAVHTSNFSPTLLEVPPNGHRSRLAHATAPTQLIGLPTRAPAKPCPSRARMGHRVPMLECNLAPIHWGGISPVTIGLSYSFNASLTTPSYLPQSIYSPFPRHRCTVSLEITFPAGLCKQAR